MQAYDVTYPSTIGLLVDELRLELGDTFGEVTVTPTLVDEKTARMVTVADDGGPARSGVMRRRHRVNVWADSPVAAESIGIAVANGMRSRLRMLEVVGPIDVTDEIDDVITVGGKALSHYLVTGVLIVRAANRPA